VLPAKSDVPSLTAARAVWALSLVLQVSLLACTSETQVSLLQPYASAGNATGGSPGDHPDGSANGTPDSAPLADAAPSTAHLVHRYSFSGDGTHVVDSVGHANGVLMGGATLDGAGHAALDGQNDYVDLPNGLISHLTDATLIAWLSWNGGPCWQRVFDFGSTDVGEDMVGNATTSIFATPLRCVGKGPAAAFETTTAILGSVDSDQPFPVLQNLPLALVLDASAGQMRFYAAGELLGTGQMAPLAQLSDVNDWLGQSQWIQDDHLRGTYDEFRIYDSALSPDQLAAVESTGPDTVGP
jgi:hypothetical protein